MAVSEFTRPLERPWMTAIEKQFAAMSYIAAANPPQNVARNMQLTMLREAECYSWARETTTAVHMACKSIPARSSLAFKSLPSRAGWWWFGSDARVPFSALLWSVGFELEEVTLTPYVSNEHDTPEPSSFWFWKFNEPMHEMLGRVTQENNWSRDTAITNEVACRMLAAGCAWLQQRVAVMSSGPIERHRRKQLARENDAPLPSDVRVIQLRRAESTSERGKSSHDSPDWSYRWIVNGHWRNQPYKESRKLIYIMPYVKGPDDKPLKVPTHTVYSVSR